MPAESKAILQAANAAVARGDYKGFPALCTDDSNGWNREAWMAHILCLKVEALIGGSTDQPNKSASSVTTPARASHPQPRTARCG